MKTLLLGLVLSLTATSAFAGSENHEAKVLKRIYEIVTERDPGGLAAIQPDTNLAQLFGNSTQLAIPLGETFGIDGLSLGRYIDEYCRENEEGPFGVTVRGSVNATVSCVSRAILSYQKQAKAHR